jgi:tRNA G18 (ribose-2'-O)-methylase SpoU
MTIPIAISAADDPRVREFHDISEPERLRSRGLFVAESRLVVERLLRSRFTTRSLLVTPSLLESLRPALAAVNGSPDVFVAEPSVIAGMSRFPFHRGCVALGERLDGTPLDSFAAAPASAADRLVLLCGVAQPDNVGSVFRNAAAFGVGRVLLDAACADPLYRKAIRTSMGTTLDVPFASGRLTSSIVEGLRAAGYWLIALTTGASARRIDDVAPLAGERAVALIVGSEGLGIPADIERLADERVTIPMSPAVESLNLATATGIALHRLAARRLGAPAD